MGIRRSLETYDTSLYKLNIKATDESASPSNIKKTKISAYLKLSNTEDGETSPSCEDRVIFVVKNYSKKEKTEN